MAGRIMTIGLNAAQRWAVSAFFLLVPAISPLYAEYLPDPTRPPAGILAPASGVSVGREEAENQSGLHSTIISKTRRAAIIDGQTVELGEEHGNAKLVEVNEGNVVLQHAQSRKMLTLFPGVKITRKEKNEKEPAPPGKESVEKELAKPGKEPAVKE